MTVKILFTCDCSEWRWWREGADPGGRAVQGSEQAQDHGGAQQVQEGQVSGLLH